MVKIHKRTYKVEYVNLSICYDTPPISNWTKIKGRLFPLQILLLIFTFLFNKFLIRKCHFDGMTQSTRLVYFYYHDYNKLFLEYDKTFVIYYLNLKEHLCLRS